MKPTYRKSWAGKLAFLLVSEACNVKPTYRKSWAGNLLVWSDGVRPSRSNDGSLALVSCLSGGYKFTSDAFDG